MLARDRLHACGFVRDRRRVAVGFHQEHRFAIGRQADARVLLDASGGHPVEKLQRAGNDARRDDGGDRFGGVVDAVVEREHRPARGRPRHQLEQHLGDDAERALRSDEEILERVTRDVFHARAAEARHLAVGEHDFEPHHVVARDAVLEPAQPAGVLGDVAADGADALRAGIGRVEQAVSRRGLVDALVRHAWLRAQREVARIDVENRVHLREAEHHAPGLGTLPPLSPVPDPRVTIAVPLEAASRTHSATCAVVRGKATAEGRTFNAAVPSKLYGMRSSARVRTASAPTMEVRP